MIGIHIAITLPLTVRRQHGADHAGGHHPVAQHAADEQGEHAGRAVRGVTDRARLRRWWPIFWATVLGASVKPKVQMMAIITATVRAPAKLPKNTSAPVAQDAADGDAGTFVDQGQRGQREHAGQQVEAQQVQQA
jgi:hypothetical protein